MTIHAIAPAPWQSPVSEALARCEMTRALRWLPDECLDVPHYRRTSFRLFTTLPTEFTDANDAEALRVEKIRRGIA